MILTHEGDEKCIQHFILKSKEKKLLDRPRDDNIKMNGKEVGFDSLCWLKVGSLTGRNYNELSGFRKLRGFLDIADRL